MKNLNVWKLERKKNEEIKEWIAGLQQQWYKWYILSQSMCVTIFQYLGLIVPEKSVMKNFNLWKLDRKKNEKRDD